MEIVIHRRQRVDYGEQSDTTCLVPKFACCVAGPSEFSYNDFQLNVQELRFQTRFFNGLAWIVKDANIYIFKVHLNISEIQLLSS